MEQLFSWFSESAIQDATSYSVTFCKNILAALLIYFVGKWLIKKIISGTTKLMEKRNKKNVLTSLDVYSKKAVVEVTLNNIPSELADKPLKNLKLNKAYGINVLTIRRRGHVLDVTPDTILQKGDLIAVFGDYQNIKDEYGLSQTEVNPILGYTYGEEPNITAGVVPTFQHRKGSTIEDMISILNDAASTTDKKVSRSYFTAERVAAMPFLKGTGSQFVLQDKTLTEEEANNWRKSEQLKQHTPIFNKFFETYLK